MDPIIFFGAGAGRCGSMMLANLLNAETGVLALHEGKIRDIEESRQQWLPFLTLENYQAYADPDAALRIFASRRAKIPELCREHNLRAIGDIAYNNSPFVRAIREVFPSAKLIVLTRDGRDFVRSVYTNDRPDPTPVGWLDTDVQLTDLERYIAMGRLRPTAKDPIAAEWPGMNPIEKNAWLWSETYRIILDAVSEVWPADAVLLLRAEDLFADTVREYERVRRFLGFSWPKNEKVAELLTVRINARKRADSYVLPKPERWDTHTRESFWKYAAETMRRLNYAE